MASTRAGVAIASLFAACSLAAVGLVEDEGWVTRVYSDPIGIPTACAGVTGKDIRPGLQLSEEACIAMTTKAMIDHALAIQPCLPSGLPRPTHAAFIRFAYNVGAPRFCASTLAKKARAGDLRGACAELDRWNKAGGRVWPGLVARRTKERRQCEEGLRP